MRRALIIGVNDYPKCPLNGCENDATRITGLLARHYDNKVNFDCRTLLSSTHPITRDAMRGALCELFAHPADTALFYFAGHGSDSKNGILVTVDYTKNDEGIRMEEIIEEAHKGTARIKEIFIVLDCCHSGYLGGSWIASDINILPKGISILTASSPTQSALEKRGSGVFTSLVCDALEGGAADVLGNVTASRIYSYLDQTLGAWDQRPHFKANLSKLETLRTCEPAIGLDALHKIVDIFHKADFTLTLSPEYEPTEAPADEEKERVFSVLQRYRAARLLVPVGTDHLYYAAKEGKACRLTPLGRFYWKLVADGQL